MCGMRWRYVIRNMLFAALDQLTEKHHEFA